MNFFGIYIHVPFCRQACSYCDFYFVTRESLMSEYITSLCNEIRLVLPSYSDGKTLQTIYLGGGTPSRLPIRDVESVIKSIFENSAQHQISEITLEANPDDITKEYLNDLKSIGVSRLSMGIQSFDPVLLKFMNRAHTADEARRSLELIHDTGFKTFSADLIYGNPGQTDDSLQNDIQCLLDLSPPHISAYALTIEPGTRLGKVSSLGRLVPADDELVARHMQIVTDTLLSRGIMRYEVSNFSLPGHESIHNSNYWSHTPYIGFGPAAHSLEIVSEKSGKILSGTRYSNPRDLKKWIISPHVRGEIEELTPSQLAEERLLMGLRTATGVSIAELKHRYDYELSDRQIQWIQKRDDLTLDGSLKIRPGGFAIADSLILEIITRH